MFHRRLDHYHANDLDVHACSYYVDESRLRRKTDRHFYCSSILRRCVRPSVRQSFPRLSRVITVTSRQYADPSCSTNFGWPQIVPTIRATHLPVYPGTSPVVSLLSRPADAETCNEVTYTRIEQ